MIYRVKEWASNIGLQLYQLASAVAQPDDLLLVSAFLSTKLCGIKKSSSNLLFFSAIQENSRTRGEQIGGGDNQDHQRERRTNAQSQDGRGQVFVQKGRTYVAGLERHDEGQFDLLLGQVQQRDDRERAQNRQHTVEHGRRSQRHLLVSSFYMAIHVARVSFDGTI